MSKVKKPAKKASVRNAKPKGAPVKPGGRKKPVRRAAKKAPVRKAARKAVGKPAPRVPVTTFEVKPLDPVRKCGSGTSVELLFKVVERVDARCTNHLVFFDRHGWYCEHGRTCPAVGHAKKYNGQIARVS